MSNHFGKQSSLDPTADRQSSYVVGVGASAGGLEALVALFRSLPADSGMSFVVVQHLSPDFESHMDELLGRHTEMPIHRVENGMPIIPNAVYLIPPRKDMIVSGGKLLLKTQSEERALSRPIDQFLCSLASDLGRYAVGVILSGTGSDGTRGVREIHQAGGVVIAQDADSAKFDGMPQNARATGLLDAVLPPEAIAEALVRYAKDGVAPRRIFDADPLADDVDGVQGADGMQGIVQLLYKDQALDFSHYKFSTVRRRIERRIGLLSIGSPDEYLHRLKRDAKELDELYRDLLIGVTRFFRDTEAFQLLQERLITELVARAQDGDAIRLWVAGCATGEEAYSLAISVDEVIRRQGRALELKVFATDAHQGSLRIAGRGRYSQSAVEELSSDRRTRYFDQERDHFVVKPELRQKVVFAPHNLLRDAPFTQMDVVSCRNLLIYLQPNAQQKALSVLHFALKHGGGLFLGPSETPGELESEFDAIDKRWRLYVKRQDSRLPINRTIPLPFAAEKLTSTRSVRSEQVGADLLKHYDQLLERKMPPSILVDHNYKILHVFGGAERFLRPRGGRPSVQLLDNLHETLKAPVAGALQHVRRKQNAVRYTGIQCSIEEREQVLDVSVESFAESGSTNVNVSFLIEFKLSNSVKSEPIESIDNKADSAVRERIAGLEYELQSSQQNLQATVEEMETSNEELQATNEELTASNEELQSTNEELQSVNEELHTVNAEYQRRVEELAEANADMENLLATTRVGVIFLDSDLVIRRFTPEMARVLDLNPQDVGRPVVNYLHQLKSASLGKDLERVLRQRKELEVEVRDRDDRPYLMRMLPYRNGQQVAGVVATLIDILKLRKAQAESERHKFMTESAADPIALVTSQGRFTYVNPATCRALGYSSQELLQKTVTELDTQVDADRLRVLFADTNRAEEQLYSTQWRMRNGHLLPVEISLSQVVFEGANYLAFHVRDIRERIAAERELKLQHLAIESTLNGIIIANASNEALAISYANPGFCKLTGYSSEEVLGRNCRFLQGPDTDPDAVRKIREAIAAREPCRVVILNYHKDGTPFWNDLQITPVFDETGALVQFVGTQNDVTTQVRAQEDLERANLAAEDANRAKSEFLANMSHELRTPMTAVLGFADMLRRDLEQPEIIERVDTIKRNGEYLLTLLNDILDLSKIEAGKMSIEQDSVDLVEVIEDVRSLMSVRAAQAGLPLHFEWLGNVPAKITADHVRLRQVLVNLIGNAIKFTDGGSVRVTIELRNKANQPQVQISVIDTGVGMTPEQQQCLFQPFNQAGKDVAQRFGGTGLGLSISKRLAEAMNGSIDVESRKNVGSRFTLSLPVSETQLEMLRPVNELVEQPQTNNNQRPDNLPRLDARILLADDRRDVWRIGKYFLEKCGASATVVEDGRQAVDAVVRSQADGQTFDLILMDMQMPVMTGREAVAELRSQGVEIPIIALTADAMDGEREACLASGCNEYFAKPIDGSKLMNLIARLLREHGKAVSS